MSIDDVDGLAELVARRVAELIAERFDPRPLYAPRTLAKKLGISERSLRDLLRGPDR